MGEIDKQAKHDGSIKPMLWWRYRDDSFDIWTQGLEKLLEFTEYISSLITQNYPTRLVDREFERAVEVGRADIFKPTSKEIKRKVFPLVVDYNPRLPNVSKIIKKHANLSCSCS